MVRLGDPLRVRECRALQYCNELDHASSCMYDQCLNVTQDSLDNVMMLC